MLPFGKLSAPPGVEGAESWDTTVVLEMWPAVLWAAGCLPGQSLSSGGAETFSSVLEENFLVRFEESS